MQGLVPQMSREDRLEARCLRVWHSWDKAVVKVQLVHRNASKKVERPPLEAFLLERVFRLFPCSADSNHKRFGKFENDILMHAKIQEHPAIQINVGRL